jgi:uroporphyrinogen-III decarboxylase
MIHTCGSSSWAYEDYIKVGLKGVETLQPEATNMGAKHLKDTYSGRLFFHGCISTAGPMAYGTKEEVEKDVREVLEIMMPGGGYLLSPTHQIQDNSPTENVIAMYNSAHAFGEY